MKTKFQVSLFLSLSLISFNTFAWHVKDIETHLPKGIEEQIKEAEPLQTYDVTLNRDEVIPIEPAIEPPKPIARKRMHKEKALAMKKIDPCTVNTALPKDSNDTKNFEKKASQLTPEEIAMNKYSEALEFIRHGLESKAILLLEDALEACPQHFSTRTELARLYIKNQQNLQAEMILQEGLKISEQHPESLRLLAIVFERKNEFDKAVDCFNKIPEEYKSDRNTVAFLGHIYQRAGRYQMAKKQYGRLLQAEPTNPLWLLGISIALDSLGKTQDALEGYYRLQAESGLEPHLLDYVKERVTELKG